MSDPTREASPDQSAGVASRRWLEIPSPFSLEPGSLRLLGPECSLTEAQRLRIRQEKIEQPFIIDTGGMRKLFFSLVAIQRFHADAANYLDKPGAAADVILLDAFDRDGIACSLESSRFFPRRAKRLNPGDCSS